MAPMSSRSDVKEAVALAFLAGLGVSFVAAPLLLDSITAGYDDGLVAGIWSSFLVVCLLAALRDALEDDADDGVEDRTREDRL